MTQTLKTIKYAFVAQILRMVLNFVSKTIFLNVLGLEYSGVNGLFSNVLGVLSLSELGLGSAMTFALYKLVEENDIEKLKSYMAFYKKAYRVIAFAIAGVGLLLLPILPYIIEGEEGIGISKIRVYFVIYLFNTVITYFVSYKHSILYAEQKSYVWSNIDMIFNFITISAQIAILLVFRNFMAYLITATVVGIIRQIFINCYMNKKYPYLKDKNYRKISSEELAPIKKNVKALIFHNLGTVGVTQTDNIVISSFINIVTTGRVSYYNMVINAVNSIVDIVVNSAVNSVGNLIAKESVEKQHSIISKYIFVNFWTSGFASVGFYVLLSPCVKLVWGDDILLTASAVTAMVAAGYITHQLNCINYIKTVAGIFEQDKFVPMFQTVINLTFSMLLAKYIGITGVYIGTIIQAVFALVWKAVVTYKTLFNESAKKYFQKQIIYMLAVILAGAICTLIKSAVMRDGVTIFNFAIMLVVVTVVTNLTFAILFCKTEEFKYLIVTAKNLLKR